MSDKYVKPSSVAAASLLLDWLPIAEIVDKWRLFRHTPPLVLMQYIPFKLVALVVQC